MDQQQIDKWAIGVIQQLCRMNRKNDYFLMEQLSNEEREQVEQRLRQIEDGTVTITFSDTQ